MSEEEVIVKHLKNLYKESIKNNATIMTLHLEKVEMLLNLIDNQQKEIEEIKYKYEKSMETNKCLYQFDNKASIDKFYISKDKIREKIKEARKINWHTPKLVIEYFEELLEENNAK